MQDKIFQKNVLLKDYTTYKIGGPAKYFFNAKNEEDLIKAVRIAKELKLPIFILAGGSNVLVSDKGFKGLMIKIQNSKVKMQNDNPKFKIIYAEAGATLNDLINFCVRNSLTGLEWAAGIPGTVGGAVYGHAQAFGNKISDSIEKVETLDIKTLKVKSFTKTQCRFSLKNSIFKKNKNLIITSAVLRLKKGDKKEIQKKIKERLNYREKGHPLNFPSAGSTFVNPEMIIKSKKLLEKFPELKNYNKKRVIPAGYLIQNSGLAGKKMGKAQISKLHCNFIVNLGGAKAKDVFSLMKLVQKKVKNNFKILLKPEVQFVGFNKK